MRGSENPAQATEAGAARGNHARPLRRAGAMLFLLLAEYLAASYLFDIEPLLAGTGLTTGLAHIGSIAPLGAVMITATLLVGGRPLLQGLHRILRDTGPSRLTPWLLTAHLANVPLLLQASAWLTAPEHGHTVLLVCLWIASVLVMFATAVLVAIPMRGIYTVIRELRRPLTAGALAGALAWGAGIFSTELWHALSLRTMQLVAAIMTPFTEDLVYRPQQAIVGTEEFHVIISPECSGYEGIGLISVFLAVYLWVDREHLRFPRAYVLLPLAIATVWIGNAVRIALLIGVGIWISPDVALGGFHSKAGWLLFCAIGLGAVALARRSRFFAAQASTSLQPERLQGDDLDHNPTATYLMPLLVLIATKLLTGLFVTDFDHLYPVAVVAVAITLLSRRRHLQMGTWTPSWHAPAIGVALYPVWLMMFPSINASSGDALRDHVLQMPPGLAAGWIVFRVLGSCVTVPLAEELAFRGFLLRRLIDPDFTLVDTRRWTPLAVIGSSLAFGALHQAYLGGTIAGLAFAIAQRARGRLSDAVVAHTTVNTLIAADVLLRGSWHLWA